MGYTPNPFGSPSQSNILRGWGRGQKHTALTDFADQCHVAYHFGLGRYFLYVRFAGWQEALLAPILHWVGKKAYWRVGDGYRSLLDAYYGLAHSAWKTNRWHEYGYWVGLATELVEHDSLSAQALRKGEDMFIYRRPSDEPNWVRDLYRVNSPRCGDVERFYGIDWPRHRVSGHFRPDD